MVVTKQRDQSTNKGEQILKIYTDKWKYTNYLPAEKGKIKELAQGFIKTRSSTQNLAPKLFVQFSTLWRSFDNVLRSGYSGDKIMYAGDTLRLYKFVFCCYRLWGTHAILFSKRDSYSTLTLKSSQPKPSISR